MKTEHEKHSPSFDTFLNQVQNWIPKIEASLITMSRELEIKQFSRVSASPFLAPPRLEEINFSKCADDVNSLITRLATEFTAISAVGSASPEHTLLKKQYEQCLEKLQLLNHILKFRTLLQIEEKRNPAEDKSQTYLTQAKTQLSQILECVQKTPRPPLDDRKLFVLLDIPDKYLRLFAVEFTKIFIKNSLKSQEFIEQVVSSEVAAKIRVNQTIIHTKLKFELQHEITQNREEPVLPEEHIRSLNQLLEKWDGLEFILPYGPHCIALIEDSIRNYRAADIWFKDDHGYESLSTVAEVEAFFAQGKRLQPYLSGPRQPVFVAESLNHLRQLKDDFKVFEHLLAEYQKLTPAISSLQELKENEKAFETIFRELEKFKQHSHPTLKKKAHKLQVSQEVDREYACLQDELSLIKENPIPDRKAVEALEKKRVILLNKILTELLSQKDDYMMINLPKSKWVKILLTLENEFDDDLNAIFLKLPPAAQKKEMSDEKASLSFFQPVSESPSLAGAATALPLPAAEDGPALSVSENLSNSNYSPAAAAYPGKTR